jgi:hypothetical protein
MAQAMTVSLVKDIVTRGAVTPDKRRLVATRGVALADEPPVNAISRGLLKLLSKLGDPLIAD